MSSGNMRIGGFYEMPDGSIARIYGWNGARKTAWFNLDDERGGREIPEADVLSWKLRPDLDDFPNARDPRLPQVFDLFYDIKTRSMLVSALKGDADFVDIPHLHKLMADSGVHLTEAEQEDVDQASAGPRFTG